MSNITPEEYDKFVIKFNEWAGNENTRVIEAANKLGIDKPVIKEKILDLPSFDALIKRIYKADYLEHYFDDVAIQAAMRSGMIIGKEQMLTIDLIGEERKEGVIEFIDMLEDKELSDAIRDLSSYEIQALITKDVLPTYVPYINNERYTRGDVEEFLEEDGYNIDKIKSVIKGDK